MSFLADAGNEITFDYWTNPSAMFFSHTHPQYELYFCSENVSQTSVVNGVEYNYRYPCVIISSPFTVHSMSCAPEETRYERFVFYFSKKTFDSFGEHLIPKSLYCKNSGLLFRLGEEEAKYLKDIIIFANPQNSNELEITLALFLNKLLSFCPIDEAITVGTTSFYIQDVLQYIVENFSSKIDADEIAEHFAVSRSKLDRDFKIYTGGTLHSFLDDCRLNEAKSLLESHSDISISRVSEMCGFSNDTYFFAYFKKHTGMTPIEYRKKKLTDNRKEAVKL